MSVAVYYLYCITNRINQKVYIGQSIEPEKRWQKHQYSAQVLPTQMVHHAMKKYGIENFSFEIIASCKTLNDANETETLLVSQYESHVSTGKGYNVSAGGSNAPKTEEWKQKISKILMGHEVTQQTRDKIAKANTGQICYEEKRKKISILHTGKIVSKETRLKLSEINKGNKNAIGNKNGLGYKHTDEDKIKIGDAARGRITKYRGKTWKTINGKRIWLDKIPPGHKKCTKCSRIKDVINFSKRTDGGLFSWCKKCFNEYRLERRKINDKLHR